MRAGDGALPTLDACFRHPHRDLGSDVALLVLRRRRRVRAVRGQLGHWQLVAAPGNDLTEHLPHELGRVLGHRQAHTDLAGRPLGHLNLRHLVYPDLDRAIVHLHDTIAVPTVALFGKLFHQLDRLVLRQDARDLEKGGLHDRVDPHPQADLIGLGIGVDDVKLGFLLDQLFLQLTRQVIPHLIRPIGAVEQERAALHQRTQHVILFDKGKVVARHKVCVRDQVGAADRLLAKAEV